VKPTLHAIEARTGAKVAQSAKGIGAMFADENPLRDRRGLRRTDEDAPPTPPPLDVPVPYVVIDAGGSVVSANDAWTSLTGQRAFDAEADGWLDAIDPVDRDVAREFARRHVGSDHDGVETVRLVPGARAEWVELRTGFRRLGETGRVLAAIDVTRHVLLEANLLRSTTYDVGTGLVTSDAFQDHIQRAVARRRRRPVTLAVALLQMSDLAESEFIRAARRARALLRGEDVLARLPGDRLGVLLDSPRQPADAVAVIRRVVDAIQEAGGVCVAGIAYVGSASGDDRLLSLAEEALADALEKGRPMNLAPLRERPGASGHPQGADS
jgi:PAS domain S-box-containing protein